MGFFSRLKKLVSINDTKESETDRSDFVITDLDYVRQIELGPVENMNYYLSLMKRIVEDSDPDPNGYGFNSITIRVEPPVKLLDRKINVNEFKNKFIEKGFFLKQVGYWGLSNMKVEEFALVKDNFQFFCGYKNKIISSIYFNNTDNQEQFNSIALQLSTEYNLVLVDWWLGNVYMAQDLNEINRFHNRYNDDET